MTIESTAKRHNDIPLTASVTAKIKKRLTTSNVGKNVEQLELLYFASRDIKCYHDLEKLFNIFLPKKPYNSILRYLSKRNKNTFP